MREERFDDGRQDPSDGPSRPRASGDMTPPSGYTIPRSDYTTPPSDDTTAGTYETEQSGWTGWIAFAGVMMIIAGSLNALYGLIGIVNDEWVVWTNQASVYLDLSQWGAVHLIVGLVMLLSGIGVFSGNILARTVGVIVASLSLIANFFFIPAYPAVGAHRDHDRSSGDLGAHRPRQRDATGLSRDREIFTPR